MRGTGRQFVVAIIGVLVLVGAAAACSSDSDGRGEDGATKDEASQQSSGDGILHVPEDHPTIQDAVTAAEPGTLILVEPGTYHEAVDVTTDRITIRGTDRNTVVLDGEFELENGIRVLDASGVVVENLTARNYTSNGFFWTGVDGYRGSYLTAYRNGDYGVYAFDSVNGQFDHSFASGSPDAGFYIGQCYPCNAVIDSVISEYNGLGYSGTNSGGELYIVNSEFRFNRAGVVPNSGSYELCYPERETTVVGNLVHENNQADSPAIDVALLAMGNGILLPGGVNNTIERNRIWDHERTGIGLVPFPEEDASDVEPPASEDERPCSESREDETPEPDSVGSVLWQPRGNVVRENVVEGSGLADLGVGTIDADPASLGNCFADNTFTTTAPTALEALAPCEGVSSGDWAAGALDLVSLIASERPPPGDYATQPVPPEQPSMPDAADSPVVPAPTGQPTIDVAAIRVPDRPAGA